MSVVGDDVGTFEVRPVNIRLKHERLRAGFLQARIQIAIEDEVERLAAVRAGGIDLDGESLVTQVPLHEGRCYRIFGSSSPDFLATAETQTVRCSLYSDWKGPAYRAHIVEYEKK